ncbi:methylated-DNA--[protein]-cysteine S-methyltransferase [Bacillus sp. B15-48]|uniref:methylated-DNA--[protein]-cysteine S-methyltransferase n=1 Tax=Bacillus sp. B15-48 TaxID=1548601 RepID=UPI00193F2A51|nr:methylated-DNA--[protein]-cysteine S-methyltransferase [Bacillus sp. B15-48]
MRVYTTVETEIGLLHIVAQDRKLSAIYFGKEDFLENEKGNVVIEKQEDDLLVSCVTQLKEYFSGNREKFELPIERVGTDFQIAVWNKLEEIPFGTTHSYQDIAISIGRPKAVRAVGQANKANKFPIIVPCHRVIGKNHKLTGYAGTKIDIKEKLLRHEGVVSTKV